MTEAEWLTASDPKPMLEFLSATARASDRKLRLFACACVRRLGLADTSESDDLVEIGERFADGNISEKAMRKIRSQRGAQGGYSSDWAADNAFHAIIARTGMAAATGASTYGVHYVYFRSIETQRRSDSWLDELPNAPGLAARGGENSAQVKLMVEIFGNPFRLITFIPSWRTPTTTSLAQAIYDERQLPSGVFDNQRMVVLADALEEAGCDNHDIIDHCRSGGDHMRGCWVVDLVLGKE